MKQVESVRGRVVIYECYGQIACQCFCQEAVNRFVQLGKLVLTGSYNEERHASRKIID